MLSLFPTPYQVAKLTRTQTSLIRMHRDLVDALAAVREAFQQKLSRALDKHLAPASAPKVGRNDPCPCGSGKKYKKCCLGNP